MADQTDISQFIPETAPETGSAQISQDIQEVGASTSAAQISQDITEIGSNASAAQISQLEIESAPDHATVIISQLTIELGRGPEIVPPEDSPLGTFTVGFGGLDINWYLIPSVSDDDVELRSKVIKSVRVTGKITNANAKVYTYQPTEEINVDDLEDGVNAQVTVPLTTTTQVVQSERFPVNCPNAVLETVRIEGQWRGTGIPDRIDEICWERAVQGVRR